ncbi:hypothetical protein CLU79DRAFT_773790 [Phycomyces nitens]|nr:hypothetical protein CLU79DRAFT_773790 [Phycomyces nitens]
MGKKSAKKARLANEAKNRANNDIGAHETTERHNGGEDFISLEPEDGRSRQEKRHEERKKRKRSNIESDADDENIVEVLCPWMESMRNTCLQPGITASQLYARELNCLLQYLEPTPIEIQMRQYLVYKIQKVVEQSISPHAKVKVFGSFATNLFLPDSDIDLSVISPIPVKLRRLASALDIAGICKDLQVISNATVPVIKFEDSLTRLKVDIIMDSTAGVQGAEVISKMIRSTPALRPLTMLIKLFLATRSLNEVFTGGLGGYAIVCLVMSFLQHHPKIQSGSIVPENNLATLLLDFFQLYGFGFNMRMTGVSIEGKGSYFYKNITVSRTGQPVFNIKDPRDKYNDIGCKSYNAVSVIRCFRAAYLTLTGNIYKKVELIESMDKDDPAFKDRLCEKSILAPAFFVLNSTIQQRHFIQSVYRLKRWKGEEAAKTFEWGTVERAYS